MASREVEIIIELVDRFSKDAKTIGQALARLNDEAKASISLEKQRAAAFEKNSKSVRDTLEKEAAAAKSLNKQKEAAYKESRSILEKEASAVKSLDAQREASSKKSRALLEKNIAVLNKEVAAVKSLNDQKEAAYRKNRAILEKEAAAAKSLSAQKEAAYKKELANQKKLIAIKKKTALESIKVEQAQIASNKRIASSYGLVSKVAGSLVAVHTLKRTAVALAKTADVWTNMGSKIRVVAKETESYKDIQNEVVNVALRSRTSLEATAKIYQRIAVSQRGLNLSTDETLKIVETINKSLVLYGASASEAQAATVQLSQAFASGVLRGDEFRSVAESGVGVLKIFADHLNLSVGELRNFAYEGKLTADIMRESLLAAAEQINKEFGNVAVTFSTAAENMRTEWTKLIGVLGESTGISESATTGIQAMAEGFGLLSIAVEDSIDHTSKYAKQISDLDLEKAIKGTEALKVAIREEGKTLDENKDKIAQLEAELKNLGITYNSTAEDIIKYGEKTRELRSLYGEFGNLLKDEEANLDSLNSAFARLTDQTGISITSIEGFNAAIESGKIILDEVTDQYVRAKGVFAEVGIEVDAISESMMAAIENLVSLDVEPSVFLANFKTIITNVSEEYFPKLRDSIQYAMETGSLSIQEGEAALALFEDKIKQVAITAKNYTYTIKDQAENFNKLAIGMQSLTKETFPEYQEKISKLMQTEALSIEQKQLLVEELLKVNKALYGTGEAVDNAAKKFKELEEAERFSLGAVWEIEKAYREGKITLEEYIDATQRLIGKFIDERKAAREATEAIEENTAATTEGARAAGVALQERSNAGKQFYGTLAAALRTIGEEAGLAGEALEKFMLDNMDAIVRAYQVGGGKVERLLKKLAAEAEVLAKQISGIGGELGDLPPYSGSGDRPGVGSQPITPYAQTDPELLTALKDITIQNREQAERLQQNQNEFNDRILQLYSTDRQVNVYLDGDEVGNSVINRLELRAELTT